MDVIARLPDCDGRAADAISAYTQMEDAPDCSQFRSQSVQVLGSVFHNTDGPSHGLTLKTHWYFLNEICTVTHSQLLWERQFEEGLL